MGLEQRCEFGSLFELPHLMGFSLAARFCIGFHCFWERCEIGEERCRLRRADCVRQCDAGSAATNVAGSRRCRQALPAGGRAEAVGAESFVQTADGGMVIYK